MLTGRPIFIFCLIVYTLSCIGTALCPTNAYWLLMLLRIFQVRFDHDDVPLTQQSTGGSCLIAVGMGVVADIALPHERGKYVGGFNLSTTFGTASACCH